MLPTRFGNPLWFSDDEILELKGTNLYHATELQVNLGTLVPAPTFLTYMVNSLLPFQKKKLLSLFHEQVEGLVKKLLILDGDSQRLADLTHIYTLLQMQNSASLMASQSYFVFSFPAARSPLNTFSGMLAGVLFFLLSIFSAESIV